MAVTHKEAYRTLRQLFIKNYKEGGITTFYRGFTASMMGVMVYGGCSFSTYDTLKPLLAGKLFIKAKTRFVITGQSAKAKKMAWIRKKIDKIREAF